MGLKLREIAVADFSTGYIISGRDTRKPTVYVQPSFVMLDCALLRTAILGCLDSMDCGTMEWCSFFWGGGGGIQVSRPGARLGTHRKTSTVPLAWAQLAPNVQPGPHWVVGIVDGTG